MNIKSLIRNKFFLFFCFFIFFFSFFFNKKYANMGVFPIDTFYHFDSALGILNGKIPIRDYWIVSGLAVDYLQSFFFYYLVRSGTHILFTHLCLTDYYQ